MIHYDETFEFDNSVGHFKIHAYTEEHPSGYGNGTLLRFDVDSDFPVPRHQSFDVRYERDDMATLARRVIKADYGVEV